MKATSDQPTPVKPDLRQIILFAGWGCFAGVVSYTFTWLLSLGEPFLNSITVGVITVGSCACILGGSSRLLRPTANSGQPISPGVTTGKYLQILSSKMRETQYRSFSQDPSRTPLHFEAEKASRPTPGRDLAFRAKPQHTLRITKPAGTRQHGGTG